MKKMIFAAFSFMAIGSAVSAEIKGAFGISFGETISEDIEVLDVRQSIPITSESSTGDTWSFAFQRLQIVPPVSNSIFLDYEVMLTPISRVPFSVTAYGEFENLSNCYASQRRVIKLLMQKYPDATIEDMPYLPYQVIKSGSVSVSVMCIDHEPSSVNSGLSIIYQDEVARTRAIDERLKTKDLEVTSDGF
ncbi:hypothetical protein [Ruegeria sp. HKCCSP335]|uniref:hypothetical protein n=1 Tax=Ruegeria sp. HKCCSP335 TaxID=2794833 RepID=UPI001AE0F479|nr:hypothetical protein [Ruegeria sp. HKCCSP335]